MIERAPTRDAIARRTFNMDKQNSSIICCCLLLLPKTAASQKTGGPIQQGEEQAVRTATTNSMTALN